MTKIQISKYLVPAIIIIVGVFVSYSIIAQAQIENIAFPVKELGNCKNETECRNFCEVKENIIPCVNFAEQRGLISKEEAKRAKEFAKMGEGPGGCKSKDECEAYCDDNAHIDECLAFAEQNNLIPADELEEAKKVAKALREGAQLPGGCKKKSDCETYCDNPEHMEECIAFAEKAGFIPPDELEDAKKAMKAMKSGIKPPGNCRGRKQCDAYCSQPEHMEECFAFAEAAGFIPPEEAEMARKMMPLMMRGEMPGGCRGKEQCETYCADETHMEECANFAIKAGLMNPEEAEMFRKTGGKGPGGCQGREQCEAFCNDPANQEVCFNFAQEHGIIPAEKIQEMKEGMKMMREGMQMAPPEVHECLKSTVGTEILDKIQAGTLTPGPQIGDSVRKCFEQFMPTGGPPGGMPGGAEGMMPPAGMMPGGFQGPGGCGSPEECQRYCAEHQEECMNWAREQRPGLPTGEGPGEMMPPAGMPSPEMIQKMMLEGIKPPEGMMMPGNMMPPEGTNIQMPPPETQTAPPPETGSNLLRIIQNFLKNFFK